MAQFTYVDANTAHITVEDDARLGQSGAYLVAYPYERGWFIPLPNAESIPALIEQLREEGYSDDFAELLLHCQAVGASLLRLDGDGCEIDDLNINDW